MKFKNLATNEVVNVSNLTIKSGRVFFSVRGKGCGQRFFNRNTCVVLDEEAENGTFLKCADGWELVEGERISRKPKPQPEVAAEPVADTENVVPAQPAEAEVNNEPEVVDEIVEGYVVDAEAGMEMEQIERELNKKYGSMGADIFKAVCKVVNNTPAREATNVSADSIREVVNSVLSEWSKVDGKKLRRIVARAASDNETHCGDFDEICDYVADGQPVYMYGAAGCGKSHTAEQIANKLNLDFYTQSQVLFAHDVKGYGDANGNYIETPFFKAFVNGGVFFIDEMDASAAEALVVLNTAIANRRYDFPVIGNVVAHPDFRIIAAGNTALTGPDIEYVARSVQDASTVNRFSFFEMKYEKDVELPIMAGGDEELYSFVCDLREAIASAGVQLCISYRQTAVLATEKAVKYGRDKGLLRNVFGGREKDEIRVIYGQLKNTSNVWAKAMRKLF